MTRRERLERRLEKREEWAGKADARSSVAFNRVHAIADNIPLGQPILVGHHSERHARRDVERIDNGMRRGCEEQSKAEHHRAVASELERTLKRSIFSDDEDAITELEARADKHEKQADQLADINKAWRKCKGNMDAFLTLGLITQERTIERFRALKPTDKPFEAWQITNLRARVRTDRERIKFLQAQLVRRKAAEESTTGYTIEGAEYVRVTFAEKPERETLDSLKAAGFSWSGGSWIGRREKLPAELTA